MADNHLGCRAHLTDILDILVFQLVADAQDDGERGAELVSYVSEEDLTYALRVSHHQLLGVSRVQVVPQEDDDRHCQQQHQEGHNQKGILLQAFRLVVGLRLFLLLNVVEALLLHTHIIDVCDGTLVQTTGNQAVVAHVFLVRKLLVVQFLIFVPVQLMLNVQGCAESSVGLVLVGYQAEDVAHAVIGVSQVLLCSPVVSVLISCAQRQ